MPTPEEQLQTMIANLEADSGKPLSWWLDVVDRSGLTKHGEKVAYLKSEHGLGHGYANAVVALAKQRSEGVAGSDDLVEAQYRGKEQLRPIHDAIIAAVTDFGADVEIGAQEEQRQPATLQAVRSHRAGDQDPRGHRHQPQRG